MRFECCRSIRIKMPPSANRMWRVANLKQDRYSMMTSNSKLVATDQYLTWQQECQIVAVGCPRWELESKDFVVFIDAGPFSGKRDLDNICKPIIDMLHKLNLTPDDRYMKMLIATRNSWMLRSLIGSNNDFKKPPRSGEVDVYFAAAPLRGN